MSGKDKDPEEKEDPGAIETGMEGDVWPPDAIYFDCKACGRATWRYPYEEGHKRTLCPECIEFRHPA